MNVCFVILGLLVAAEAVSLFDATLEEWKLFKVKYNKNYTSDKEDKLRLKVYLDNKRKITKHNTKYDKGLVSFKMGINKFGDMLPHETTSTLNGLYKSINIHTQIVIGDVSPDIIKSANNPPKSFDWREYGAVTPVQDEGPCKADWAFSVIGATEAAWFNHTGKLVPLSVQQLIDCITVSKGCKGGDMRGTYVSTVLEITCFYTEKSYPYKAQDGICSDSVRECGASEYKGFTMIPRYEIELMRAVASTPVSVLIDASHESFRLYKEGVYFEPKCNSNKVNRAVLIVGYGTDEKTGEDYWIVKNSWGEDWGEKGYIRVARNKGNHCGIGSQGVFPSYN